MILLVKLYMKKGGFMRKTIILLSTLLFFSCSNNEYTKLTKEGFKKSNIPNVKTKVVSDKTYYKYDYTKKFWQEELFLLIESGEKSTLYMGVNYRGKDWLYMSSIEFIGDENLLIDFSDYKYYNPIWKDNVTLNMGVEEKILFPLKPEYIETLQKLVLNKNLKVILRNSYDDKFAMRTLTDGEAQRMKEILDLYKSIKKENETKKDSLKEKERTEDGN